MKRFLIKKGANMADVESDIFVDILDYIYDNFCIEEECDTYEVEKDFEIIITKKIKKEKPKLRLIKIKSATNE